MPDEIQDAKPGPARWFLRKLFTAPGTYLGIAAGIAAGHAALGAEIPMSGAIGGGMMIGLFVGAVSFLIMHGIKASHKKATDSSSTGETSSKEQEVLASLRDSGQSDDADLLDKMFGDRDAISRRCHGQEENPDAVHTLELTSAIVKESCLQAEELQDLVRRAKDPLLDSPDEADSKIEGIRRDLQRAYQAVADAGSRLRRGGQLKEIDFLGDTKSLASLNLSSLSSQLEEETAVSKRIEERLRPGFERKIVIDDPVATNDEDPRESE